MKLDRAEKRELLAREPRTGDVMNSLEAVSKLSRRCYGNVLEAVALARKFTDRCVRPAYKQIDLKVHEDNDYLPLEFIREAGRWGIFSWWIPKLFGGKGLDFIAMYPFLEEIASACTGLANVIGVHYLGVGTLCASWNMPVMNKILREVCAGDKTGAPCLLSLAITEPEAGTDVEEPILLDRARIGTIAKRVEGGYVLNGRKIFISNGHVSTWHMVIAYEDRKNPNETTVMAAVKTGTAGFTLGRHEKKMGQKACVASELIFDDCFVPDGLVCLSPGELGNIKKSRRSISQYVIDFIVSSSRTGVGAFAAGAARGAYQTALEYASVTTVQGKPLVNHEWAQVLLSEMYKNVNTARAIYMESACANALKGMYKMMSNRLVSFLVSRLPVWYFTLFLGPYVRSKFATRASRKYYFEEYTDEEAQVSSGWASLVKFSASDIAVRNSSLAISLMGVDGTRHDRGAEKFLRDAKLLQIYEGTNQLNRLNLFKNLVGRNRPGVEFFQ
jgi:acyl-CoA dehydrogenase